ncbi:MAG: TMEM143 family protein [Pirellulaceae bacterium]
MLSKSRRTVRVAQESTSGEYIAEDAPHWNAEPFIPVTATELKSVLLRQAESAGGSEHLQRVFESLTSILNHDYRNLHQQLETHYSVLDPDRDLKLLTPPSHEQCELSQQRMQGYLCTLLRGANFTQLDRDQIRGAMHGSSYWGVRLRVNFDIFESLEVYARGDVIGIRKHRHWRTYWKLSEVEVPIYQRLVAVFKLKPDVKLPGGQATGEFDSDRLHLSMFKNIPQADVDMLLPGTDIRFSWLDRTKIFAPTLGGIGMTIFKIIRGAVVIAATGLAAVLGIAVLVAGIVGYAIRSVFTYFRTKDKYLLNMTRSLYFQKLDTNAGVIYRLLQEARQQELLEAIVVYYVLANASEPISQSELSRRIEQMLKEILDVEVRFDPQSSMKRMRRLGIIVDGGAKTISVLSPELSITQLDHYWDNLITCDRQDPYLA